LENFTASLSVYKHTDTHVLLPNQKKDYANATALDSFGEESGIPGGTYDIWVSRQGGNDVMLLDSTAVIKPGDTVTIVFALDKDYKLGRDTQLKLTTTNGNIFVASIVIGMQVG